MSGFPEVGDRFGAYEITDVIGHGGMGVVFSARQTPLNRMVALKVLDPKFAHDPEFAVRFSREAEILASMDSPHVIQVFDHGTVNGCLFLATQWVPGGDLADYVHRNGPLPLTLAINVTIQIASALADAHARGVIHRDVKPSNVLLATTGQDLFAYLCDFGIAQDQQTGLTQPGLLAGSFAYTAPERNEGHPATERSDLYSLGCLLWTIVTGSNPYSGTEFQIATQHSTSPIPRLKETGPLETGLNVAFSRLMAKDPALRPASAIDVVTELRQLVGLPQGGHLIAPMAGLISSADPEPTRVRPTHSMIGVSEFVPNAADAPLNSAATIRRSDLQQPPAAQPRVAEKPALPPRHRWLRVAGVSAALVAVVAVIIGAAPLVWSRLAEPKATGAVSDAPESPESSGPTSASATTAAAQPERRSRAQRLAASVNLEKDPHAVVVDPRSRRAFVTNYGSGTVSVLDLTGPRVQRVLKVGGQPESLAIDTATNLLLVTTGDQLKLRAVDLETLATVATLPTGPEPSRVVAHGSGGEAVVASQGSSALNVVDLKALSESSSIPVEAHPQGVAIDEARHVAYVTHWKSNHVSVVDLQSRSTVNQVTVGKDPNGIAIAPGVGIALVANWSSDSVSIIDLDGQLEVERISVGDSPSRVAVDETAGVAYVTCLGDDEVQVIDLLSRAVVDIIKVADRPVGVAVDPTTGDVLVTSFNDDVVQFFKS